MMMHIMATRSKPRTCGEAGPLGGRRRVATRAQGSRCHGVSASVAGSPHRAAVSYPKT